MLAFAALAAVASCEGARWREPAPAREPTRTVLSKDCRSIITIETPSGLYVVAHCSCSGIYAATQCASLPL